MDMKKILSMANVGTEEYIYMGTACFDSTFNIILAGMTYPDSKYFIYHSSCKQWVFEYVIEGKGYIETNDKIHIVEAGDFYVIPAHCECCYYTDKQNPLKKVWFNLAGGLVEQICYTYNLKDITVVKTDVYHYFEDIFNILKAENLDHAKLHLKFYELIAKVGTHPLSDSENFLIKVHDYIAENADKKLNLTHISEKFFISTPHLIRLFKKQYDKSPYNFYLECKLEKAKDMLINTKCSIKEIATKLSFSDSQYFSKTFFKVYGCTPKEYRNTHLNIK